MQINNQSFIEKIRIIDAFFHQHHHKEKKYHNTISKISITIII